MTVYVDNLRNYGWIVHGTVTPSCHMFSDEIDLRELHAIAARIGMRREWFQDKTAAPTMTSSRISARRQSRRARRRLIDAALPSSGVRAVHWSKLPTTHWNHELV